MPFQIFLPMQFYSHNSSPNSLTAPLLSAIMEKGRSRNVTYNLNSEAFFSQRTDLMTSPFGLEFWMVQSWEASLLLD